MTYYSLSSGPSSGAYFKWLDEPANRLRPGFSRGFPIEDASQLPKTGQQTNNRKLDDVIPMGGETLVSGNFRQAVEEFEPGQHQFFPVTLLKKDGTPHEGDWFILNICGRIPCLIPKGEAKPSWGKYPPTGPDDRRYGLNEPRGSLHYDTCLVSKPAVSGRHLFQSWVISNPEWICSAPLFLRLKELCRGGRAEGDYWDILGLWVPNPVEDTDEPWDAAKHAPVWRDWALAHPEEVKLLGYQRFL